jgi:hypothetical protein
MWEREQTLARISGAEAGFREAQASRDRQADALTGWSPFRLGGRAAFALPMNQ